jgi:non-specific serine/threonine protein kinase
MSDASTDQFVTFGALLKHLRRRARLTQDELGSAVGYSGAYITRLEGNTRLPSLEVVRSVFAEALGLPNESVLARRLIALAEGARSRSMPARNGVSPRASWAALPSPLSSFIGRQQELTQIQQLVLSHRLVTLTGSGGVGKTRLSLETAGAIADHFDDGVRLVEFAPLIDPALVPQSISRAVGLTNRQDTEHMSALREHLVDREILIVFDNCEHLIDACATAADTLLRACPGLRILATSRESLRIDGEMPWRVPPLTAGDAARLFAERAGAVRPGFALSEQNAANIALIGARLDGIPLAIELAASRLSGLSVEQLASRLGDRFNLLTDGSRAALPRHRTLRALIDWSYDLLSDQQRVLFRRLSVFVGGFTAAAAEGVCAAIDAPTPETRNLYAANVLPLLLDLVSKSLIVADDSQTETRYRFLETILEYARDRLAQSDEVAYLRERHARWCLDFVMQSAPADMRETGSAIQFISGAHSEAWVKRIGLDYDNLRAALRWSLGEGRDAELGAQLAHWLYVFWTTSGPRAEAMDWIGRALDLGSGSLSALTRARLLSALADFALNAGDFGRSRLACDEAIALCRGLDARFDLMRALQMRASDLMQRGDQDGARNAINEWLSIARALGSSRYEGIALFWSGLCALNIGHLDEAEALIEESMRATPASEFGTIVVIKFHQGLVRWWRGDCDAAMRDYEQALAHFRKTGFEYGTATVLSAIGDAHLFGGDGVRAELAFAESVRLLYGTGAHQRLPWPLAGLAAVSADRGEVIRAATLWSAVSALRAQTNSGDHTMTLKLIRERVEAACARLSEAARTAAERAGRAMNTDETVAFALAD